MSVFGQTEENSVTSLSLENMIHGSWFTCPEAGTADSITVYGDRHAGKIKCAIYKRSDNTLVGVTEERVFTDSEYLVWETYNFIAPKPTLENIDYYLVAWGFDTYPYGQVIKGKYELVKAAYHYIEYNSFPNPWEPTGENDLLSIYCTYTPAAPPPVGLENKSAGMAAKMIAGKLI